MVMLPANFIKGTHTEDKAIRWVVDLRRFHTFLSLLQYLLIKHIL